MGNEGVTWKKIFEYSQFWPTFVHNYKL